MESELKEKINTINSILQTSNSLYTAYNTATRLIDKLESLRSSINIFNEAFLGDLIIRKGPGIFYSKLEDFHKDLADVNNSLKEIINKIDKTATRIEVLDYDFGTLSEEKIRKII